MSSTSSRSNGARPSQILSCDELHIIHKGELSVTQLRGMRATSCSPRLAQSVACNNRSPRSGRPGEPDWPAPFVRVSSVSCSLFSWLHVVARTSRPPCTRPGPVNCWPPATSSMRGQKVSMRCRSHPRTPRPASCWPGLPSATATSARCSVTWRSSSARIQSTCRRGSTSPACCSSGRTTAAPSGWSSRPSASHPTIRACA